MRVIEVHWSDERNEQWYFVRRVGDEKKEDKELTEVKDQFSRSPRYRFGDLITPTFRVRTID